MKPYFVATNDRAENVAIKEVEPQNLLLSYYYWKRRDIDKYIKKIGYKPKILLDSGAYSAHTQGKHLSVLNYIDYIKENQKYIDEYISLDVIGKPELTFMFYKIMRLEGMEPVPVFHYGEAERWLKKYINWGNNAIALGGSAPIRPKTEVAKWINYLSAKYECEFHLLGSSSKHIINRCPGLRSFDSSSYILMASNGYPKGVKHKTKRATINMRKTIGLVKGGEKDGHKPGN